MAQVTKEMRIGEILRLDSGDGIARILMNSGMHCVGCPSAQGESLAEAAEVHGMDAESITNEINSYLMAGAR